MKKLRLRICVPYGRKNDAMPFTLPSLENKESGIHYYEKISSEQ